MARPKKDNADYFSHDADMRNDAKIKAIRRKFKIEGYGVYCMLLEILTDKDFFKLEWNELSIELISADIEIEPNKLKEIVNYLVNTLKMFNVEDGFLYCEKLIFRFESLLIKRKRDKNYIKKELSTPKTPQKEIIDTENPQNKVKESKVKESDNYIYTENDFLKRWKDARLFYDKKPTNITKLIQSEKVNFNYIVKNYTPKQIDEAISGLFFQDTYKSTRLRPTHFLELEHFEKYLTCFQTKEKLFTNNIKKVERL